MGARPSSLGQPIYPGTKWPPRVTPLNFGSFINLQKFSTFHQVPHRPPGPIPTALCVAHSVHWLLTLHPVCSLRTFLLDLGLPLIYSHSPLPGIPLLISRAAAGLYQSLLRACPRVQTLHGDIGVSICFLESGNQVTAPRALRKPGHGGVLTACLGLQVSEKSD